jgi:hypothetical protein
MRKSKFSESQKPDSARNAMTSHAAESRGPRRDADRYVYHRTDLLVGTSPRSSARSSRPSGGDEPAARTRRPSCRYVRTMIQTVSAVGLQ